MKVKRALLALLLVAVATSVVFAADDGPLFHRNISGTPDTMTGARSRSGAAQYKRAAPDRQ